MTLNLSAIARVCHEANRALQLETGDLAVSPHWDEAPDWQRESAVEGVAHAIGGASPADLHDQWSAFKRADGWVYGAIKNAEVKTHPCLVAYAELPAEQRVKDELFSNIVRALGAL